MNSNAHSSDRERGVNTPSNDFLARYKDLVIRSFWFALLVHRFRKNRQCFVSRSSFVKVWKTSARCKSLSWRANAAQIRTSKALLSNFACYFILTWHTSFFLNHKNKHRLHFSFWLSFFRRYLLWYFLAVGQYCIRKIFRRLRSF